MKSLSKLFRYGPGPSSSHTIAPAIAARAFRSLWPKKRLESTDIRVTLYGSLAL
jgi:L-serine dehydratase